MLRSADRPFIVVREEALFLMCEEEARAVRMRPVVEKAAPALSGPVGGSVSNLSVGDVSVDMELCGVDTVLSSAVSGVCVTWTGCQEVVTRMRVVLTRWCQVLLVYVCVTLTVCDQMPWLFVLVR